MSGAEQIVQLRISLAEITPEIWRRVEVPVNLHLKGLHDVIQAAFGWEDYHLFEFRIGEKIYGIPAPEEDYGRKVMQAKSARLATFLARGIHRFEYEYDFGDSWEHVIAVETVTDADPGAFYPRFVAGERRGPPEDVGGPPGYEHYLEAIADKRHPDHAEMVSWRGAKYDPDDIDLALIRYRLAGIAQRRETGKAAFMKSRRSR
jgi:hypothetical protein